MARGAGGDDGQVEVRFPVAERFSHRAVAVLDRQLAQNGFNFLFGEHDAVLVGFRGYVTNLALFEVAHHTVLGHLNHTRVLALRARVHKAHVLVPPPALATHHHAHDGIQKGVVEERGGDGVVENERNSALRDADLAGEGARLPGNKGVGRVESANEMGIDDRTSRSGSGGRFRSGR